MIVFISFFNCRFSRYTVAALQTKVENYEREIARLRRALERSDEYVEEIKRQIHAQNHPQDLAEYPVRSCNDFSCSEQHEVVVNETSAASCVSPRRTTANALDASRIDELANIALATRHLPFDSDNANLAQKSPIFIEENQMDQPIIYSNDGAGNSPGCNASTESQRGRSVFEDSEKFPACAKLIELTKCRRANNEQAAIPSPDGLNSFPNNNYKSELKEASMRKGTLLNILMQPRQGVGSPMSSSMVGREGSAFSFVGNQLSRSTECLPSALSPARSGIAEDFQNDFSQEESPPTLLQGAFAAGPSGLQDNDPNGEPDQRQVYPSSVILMDNQADDGIYGKRIKIEQGD